MRMKVVFPLPFRAEKSVDFPAAHLEIDCVHDLLVAEFFGDTGDVDDEVRGRGSCRSGGHA